MKYTRLTKEQLEELHPEFSNFLATQSIDKKEWDKIKTEQPHIAEQELDVFSDLIWEGVLTRAEYLENFSKSHGFLFHCGESHVHSIVLRVKDESVDLLTNEGMKFLSDNMFTDVIEIRTGKKEYSEERNKAIFDLIQQGAFLSDGRFYNELERIISG